MPSPFPGMDPYLEHPAHWPDVHTRLIAGIGDALGPSIRPKYVARLEERTYLPDPDDPGVMVMIPDVRVEETGRWAPIASGATATIAAPVETITMLENEFREARVEIVEVASRKVVTVIEVLSPSNKIAGSAGRRSFVAKRGEILNSPVHWVEIDLLRGRPFIDAKIYNRLQPLDYYVHVSKSEERPRGKVWPIRLEQPLPTVGIPLRSPDPDAPLDLQAVFAAFYDRAGYDLTIDYSREAVPPLSKAQALWARKLLPKRRRK